MPVSEARLRLVETMLPLGVVEISHLIGSIAGVSLLLLVYGMQQRLRWAWALSAGAARCRSFLVMMLKGFAWEEAINAGAASPCLAASAARIPAAKPCHLSEQHASGWLVAIAVVLTAAFWLGLFSYRHLDDNAMVALHALR